MDTKEAKPLIRAGRLALGPGLVERVASAIVLTIVTSAVAIGWLGREQLRLLIDPEQGFGYALGIIGGTMMLILLGYPLRKRFRSRSTTLGTVGFWFRFHMLLGLLGPLAILFHSRFELGSLNSTMALGAMVVVASSGILGRFLYSRVHRGYSERKLELRALKQEMDGLLNVLGDDGLLAGSIRNELEIFEATAIRASGAFWTSARAVLGVSLRSRMAERRLFAKLAEETPDLYASARALLVNFFGAARRAAEFAFYDRLLRLWHLLHLPLFIILVAAALLHILAVHMY